VKAALAYTLQRLGTHYVDLYWPARLDPPVPIEDTVGSIADCVRAGDVDNIGLSEMGAATNRRGHAVHLIAVQLEYPLMSRSLEAAITPISSLGMRAVVRGGSVCALPDTLSKPATAMPREMHKPASCIAAIAPDAARSMTQNTAHGRRGRARNPCISR
jgi:Aldo/keto reductase family